MKIERLSSIAFGALAAVLCMGVVLYFDAEVTKRDLGKQRIAVTNKLSTTRAKIEAALNSRLSLVEGIAAFVKSSDEIRSNRPEVFSEEFQNFSSEILKDIEGIRSLQLAPDAVVTHINPLKGNEAALGHDLRADPARRDAVEQAIRERKLIVAGPVELRQGGVALIGRLPIFLPSEGEQKERFWGFSIILIDLETLLKAGGLLEQDTGLRYAIRGKDGLGAQGAVFYGKKALFDASPVVLEVYLPNGFWQIAAVPAEGWGGEIPDRINLWIFGSALAGVVGFLIFVLLNRPAQLRSALIALRKSEEKYTQAQEIAHLGHWSWNVATNKISWSEECYRIFGRKPEELGDTYEAFIACVHPKDRERVIANVEASISTGKPYRCEYWVISSHGSEERYIDAQGVATLDLETGDPLNLMGTVLDITERKRVEDALRESEERYAFAVSGTADGLWDWNILTNEDYQSPRWKEILGYEDHELSNRRESFTGALHPDDHDRVMEAVRAHLEEHVPYDLEYRLRRKDRSYVWVHAKGQAVWDEVGTPLRMAGSISDITERKRAEEAVYQAKEVAELANRAKSEFLANMSHELRTPLNSIIGFSEMIGNEIYGPSGDPKYGEYAGDINASGRHLLDLINDILDVSRIETDNLSLEEGKVDVGHMVKSCERLVGERAEMAGLVLKVEVSNDLPALYADERRVKQILLNLLTNAIKFTQTGGSVTLKAGVDGENRFVFTVSDTGQGIAPENLDMVMIPFRQVDRTMTSAHEGVGLGLHLSRSLAELHGAELTLDSKLNVGTTATVVFLTERTIPVG